MKIASTHFNYSKAPVFTSNQRVVFDENQEYKIKHRNTTSFFRADLDWDKFADKLIEKYKKTDKVNIYCYACSDGSEPYSLVMTLIKKMGEKKAQKFFPIKARDYDKVVVDSAKSGLINVSDTDLMLISAATGKPFGESVKLLDKSSDYDMYRQAMVSDKLRSCVEFEQSNILDDINNIELNNTILMFRNAWPYLTKKNQVMLSSIIGQKLGDNSCLVIGDFDKMRAYEIVEKLGAKLVATEDKLFYETEAPNKYFWR